MASETASVLRRHPILAALFGLAALGVLFFGVRLVAGIVYWSDPAHRDQPLEGWMTPRYVARSWDVPPEVVGAALGLDRDGLGRRITLDEVARRDGRDLPAMETALERAVAEHRKAAE